MMQLEYDNDQLNRDIDNIEYNPLNQKSHKWFILNIIKSFEDKIISTLPDAVNYLDNLQIEHCWCKHENPRYWWEAIDCTKIERNVSCTHALRFMTRWSLIKMRDGYKIFGLPLFTIAYFLYQKWYTNLEWFIPDSNFYIEQRDEKRFDDGIRLFYGRDNPSMNKITPQLLKQRQLEIWNMRIDKYVEPVREALKKYAEEIWYVVEKKIVWV